MCRGVVVVLALSMNLAAKQGEVQEYNGTEMGWQQGGVAGMDSVAGMDGGMDSVMRDGKVAEMREWLGELDRVREDLQHNDGYLMTDDELVLSLLFEPERAEGMLLRRYASDPVVAMEEVPGELFEELDVKREMLWEEINRRAAQVGQVEGVPADSAVSAAVAARVRGTVQGASVLGTVLRDKEWNVRFNALGMPVSRYRRGVAIYRVGSQPLVVCQQIAIERPLIRMPGAEDRLTVRLGFLRFQPGGRTPADVEM